MNQMIPEPWATALVTAGYTDPRYRDDRPSLGALAEAAGLHTTTVSRMVHGRGNAKHENVVAVAEALRVDVVEVSSWVRQARTEEAPYEFPSEVHLLSRREQDAITELIRAMAEYRKDREADGNAAASTQAGGSPAIKGVRMRARTPSGPLPVSPSQEPTRSRERRARR